MSKICTGCGDLKPLTAFSPAARGPFGRASRCKACLNAAAAKRRLVAGMTPRRQVPGGFKWCSRCEAVKPVDAFGNNVASKDGRTGYCKPCHNEAGRDAVERAGGSRGYHLKRRYGIDRATFDAMVATQGGRCAICRRKPAEHVDHCHLTGDVRGILCFTCNVGLGNFGDSDVRLLQAADYIQLHQSTDRSVFDGTDLSDWDLTEGADLAGFTDLWTEGA